jgi:hypothetical protein
MFVINELPKEIQTKVFMFMSHPTADIIRNNLCTIEGIGYQCFKVRCCIRLNNGKFVIVGTKDLAINFYSEYYWNCQIYKSKNGW